MLIYRIIWPKVGLLFTAMLLVISSCTPLESKDTAPALNAVDLAGNDVILSAYNGQYVVLDFWASWCGPCLREMPTLIAAYPQLESARVEIISIAIERNIEQGKKATDYFKIPWERQIIHEARFLGLDPIASDYGISEIPTAVLIDPEGAIVSYYNTSSELLSKLRELEVL